MAAKRKKKVEIVPDIVDEALVSLKNRYFALYKKENIGKTIELTKVIDKLEEAIKQKLGVK